MPLLPIPDTILKRFDAILEKRDVALALRADFKKWLQYFLDFCAKYPVPPARSDQVHLFINKLREKKQNSDQQKQAAYAVSLYFEIQQEQDIPLSLPAAIFPKTTASPRPLPRWRLWEEGYAVKSDSPEWDTAIAGLASEIKTRHYSRKTLKTYAHWSRQFQRFLLNKPPKSLSAEDVKEYLSYLAEVPPIKPEVTEYQCYTVQCTSGHINKAHLPDEVAKSNFGSRLTAIIAYLVAVAHLSRRGTEVFCQTLLGVNICLGSVQKLLEEIRCNRAC